MVQQYQEQCGVKKNKKMAPNINYSYSYSDSWPPSKAFTQSYRIPSSSEVKHTVGMFGDTDEKWTKEGR